MSLNWFMPAFANNNVGSLAGASEELRTTRCPRAAKKSRNRCRVSLPVTYSIVAEAAMHSRPMRRIDPSASKVAVTCLNDQALRFGFEHDLMILAVLVSSLLRIALLPRWATTACA